MIFCKIDKELIAIIKKEAKGRPIIDCGAGEGLLGSLMLNVISLDIIPGGLTNEGKTLSNVFPIDCTKFHFPDKCLPVFIRPCHSGFPEETIDNNLEKFETVLYVSEPKNIERDLGCIPKNFDMERIGKWVGSDGEQVYRITINKAKDVPMRKFVLVQQFQGNKRQIESRCWYELGEVEPKYKLRKLIFFNGFSYNYLGKDDVILETIKAKGWDSVDTMENRAKTTWYQKLIKNSTDKSLKIGWLSPEGVMHYCKYQDHITYVHEVLNSDVPTIEAQGWIHIFDNMKMLWANNDRRITQAQARTAREELGLDVREEDIQYQ